jgi:Family of unknown function (DUF6152)
MNSRALGLAGIALIAAMPAFAHHSFAIFDQTKVLTISGTIKDLELTNPHAWLHVAIVNDKGLAATWSFEGGSVAQLRQLGWKKENFPVGEKVVVAYRPMRDGSRGGQLMSATPEKGQKVCSNRGCGDGTGGVLAPF